MEEGRWPRCGREAVYGSESTEEQAATIRASLAAERLRASYTSTNGHDDNCTSCVCKQSAAGTNSSPNNNDVKLPPLAQFELASCGNRRHSSIPSLPAAGDVEQFANLVPQYGGSRSLRVRFAGFQKLIGAAA